MKKSAVLTTCIAFLLAATIFISGCLFFGSSCIAFSSEDWVRETIKANYFRFDGDYSFLDGLGGLSIDEMVTRLDKYSEYYTKEEYQKVLAENSGSRSGIGVSISYVNGEGVRLYSVVGNSPAHSAGLKAGDVIKSGMAQGKSTEFDSSASFTSFITEREEGERFTFVLSDGRQASLAKEQYTASYASMYTHSATYEFTYNNGVRQLLTNGGGIEQLPEGVAYLYLSQFYGDAAEEIGELFTVFVEEGCTSLILDLRDDGGGYVDVMKKIGGRFTSALGDNSYVAMTARYKSGKTAKTYCSTYSDGVLPAGTDVYVMANQNTASASEALIGVLVSYDIVKFENIFLSEYHSLNANGEEVVSAAKTYGKGIMQSAFPNFMTGEVLKLTNAGIYWAMTDQRTGDLKTIHDVGLTPDDGCSVAPAWDNIVNVGYDDELESVLRKIAADRA